MTMKQCNSCMHRINVKELGERCNKHSSKFMKNKICEVYRHGEVNQAHKEFFKRIGEEYPFTEVI